MTEHTQQIKTEIEATDANYYDEQHLTQGDLDNHDVVIAPTDNPDPNVGDMLACVSYNATEDKYAAFSGERTRGGYNVSTLESTHEDLQSAIVSAINSLSE